MPHAFCVILEISFALVVYVCAVSQALASGPNLHCIKIYITRSLTMSSGAFWGKVRAKFAPWSVFSLVYYAGTGEE